jgi:RimJ/RimL family protein N-acetyltransferase
MADAENVVWTARVGVRHPTEMDRERFAELFCGEDFMVFSDGALSREEADARFDRMLARCAELTFAKQPIVERSTGVVVGYTGVDWIEFEGRRWLEWGYRLVPSARGNGYATEASVALLNVAANEYSGEILGIIHLDNQASKNVIRKMGFKYWMRAPVQGEVRAVYRLRLGSDPHRGVSAGVVLAGQNRTQTSIGTPR